MKDDFIIVGAGLFGATFAYLAKQDGYKVRVIDKRPHIAGNCFTEKQHGIDVHTYGPHIFHTNNLKVWEFVNKFTKFNNYKHTGKVAFNDKIFSFPVNLLTLHQLFDVNTPAEARKYIDSVRVKDIDPEANFESFVLFHLGEEMYKTFFYGYTKKQWGTDPKNLPASIIKRLPIRYNFDDNYFTTSNYQGIPVEGYTKMVENMLTGVPVDLNTDFLQIKRLCERTSHKIVYTGAIDELHKYKFGQLQWRSLRFETNKLDTPDYQGTSLVNYTSEQVEYTRICEHKHFNPVDTKYTIITREYPDSWSVGKEKYYPVNTSTNNELHKKYVDALDKQYILGGRLGSYLYYDMHQIIAQAMSKYESCNKQ